MDKIMLKFLADVLYIKGVIYFSEYDAIMSSCNEKCLDAIVERMLKDEYNPYTRGEVIV